MEECILTVKPITFQRNLIGHISILFYILLREVILTIIGSGNLINKSWLISHYKILWTVLTSVILVLPPTFPKTNW